MIELRGSRAGQLERLLLRLKSAEAARQALAIVNEASQSTSIDYSDGQLCTKRRQAEAALRENEATFRAIAETATSAVFIYQAEQLRYVNPVTEQLTGYTQAELRAMNIWDLVDPELLLNTSKLRQLGKPVFLRHELELVTKSGASRCLEVVATWAKFNGRPALVCTACDATQYRQKAWIWETTPSFQLRTRLKVVD